MDETARYALPLLRAGQGQKEVTINEAMVRLDAMTALSIEGSRSAPPPPAGVGACWLIAASPTGEWSGRSGQIAVDAAGGWRFLAPRDGMAAWDVGAARELRFVGGIWRQAASGLTGAAIADPAGGSVRDVEARIAILAMLNLFRDLKLIA